MKQRIKLLIFSAGILWSLPACEFSPSEIPLTELEQPSDENVPGIWIELLPETDTLRLAAPAWVTYAVETDQRQVYGIDIQFDNAPVGNVSYESQKRVKAYIQTDLLNDGFHELKITTYTATNSGSIADKTGNEAYWYELRWPVYVNKKAKENFKLKNPELTSEGIKISWPQYNYADFDRYVFTSNYNFNVRNSTIISNPKQNSFTDNSYVEGIYTNYSVALYYKEWGHQVDDINYFEEIKKPVVIINDDCSADIRWEPSKNEQQISFYCLRTSAPNYGVPEEHDLDDMTQTGLRLNEKIGFGGDYEVQLRYIPVWFDSYHSTLNTAGGLTTFALGDSIPRFQQAFHSAAENALILYDNGTLKKYSIATGETLQAVPVTPTESVYLWTVTGSPDGNFFGHFYNQEYIIRQSSDLSVVKNLNVQAYNGYNFTLSSISLSNNGLVGVTAHDNYLRIFDIATGQKIFEKQYDSNNYIRKVMLSPNGKNLALMLNDYAPGTTSLVYYDFNGAQLSEIGRVHGVGKDGAETLAFSPESGQKLVVSRWRSTYDYNVEIRDSRTFELLNSVQVPHLFVPVAYDFSTDRIIAQIKSFPTRKYSYLLNSVTGEQKKVVQFTGREPVIFTDGNVFAGNGRKIAIDNYIFE